MWIKISRLHGQVAGIYHLSHPVYAETVTLHDQLESGEDHVRALPGLGPFVANFHLVGLRAVRVPSHLLNVTLAHQGPGTKRLAPS